MMIMAIIQEPDAGEQNYRYDQHNQVDSLKDVKEKQIQKIQESVDSLKVVKEKQIEKIKDSLRQAKINWNKKLKNWMKKRSFRRSIPSFR